MVEPDAVRLGPTRLDAPELRALVQDVTKTAGLLIRPFGIHFPPASEEEADAIAAPAARMLAKAPKVQRVIRQVADPLVLTGALVALFVGRPRTTAVTKAPQRPVPTQLYGVGASTNGAQQAPAASVPIVDPSNAATADAVQKAQVAQYLEQIMDGIAHADLR